MDQPSPVRVDPGYEGLGLPVSDPGEYVTNAPWLSYFDHVLTVKRSLYGPRKDLTAACWQGGVGVKVFSHISEFGPVGMQNVPALTYMSEKVTLWSPSARPL